MLVQVNDCDSLAHFSLKSDGFDSLLVDSASCEVAFGWAESRSADNVRASLKVVRTFLVPLGAHCE